MGLFLKTQKVEHVDDGDPNVYVSMKLEHYYVVVAMYAFVGFILGRIL